MMALRGRDKMIRDRFTRTHAINDKANLKKYEAVRLAAENVAKQLHELLPDDYSSQEPILRQLDAVVTTAQEVFEKRSAAIPAALKPKAKTGRVVQTQPLRTAQNPTGRSTPVVETDGKTSSVEVGGKLPVPAQSSPPASSDPASDTSGSAPAVQ